MAEEEQQPTAEAIKQRRKREKEAARNVAFGIEKFTIEVAGVFKRDLKKVMRAHGINNQQDIHQRLLINLIGADFKAQAAMLHRVTTPGLPYFGPRGCHGQLCIIRNKFSVSQGLRVADCIMVGANTRSPVARFMY
ncbi:hypothetical protein [Pseudomonas protegens]|uniref:hypothetical protein n=1 Tax=Pseudomonas protegens TaxID=380021 RepID=UPI00301BB2A7